MKRLSRSRLQRHGFTLVELLIVIALITLLMTILVFAIGSSVTNTRVQATRATIEKVQGQLEARMRAFDMAFEQNQFKNDIQVQQQRLVAQGLNPDQAKRIAPILVRKLKFRQLFPQTFAEMNTTAPGGHDPATESSEVLYLMLTKGAILGIPPVAEDEFTTTEVADTDGDGLKEFVDAWGQPLRFYRWPTRLIRPGSSSNATADRTTAINKGVANLLMPGLNTAILTQDPDDPTSRMYLTSGNWYSAQAFEQEFHTEATYHPPLIVSPGPDQELGLFEPLDRSNFGHLARPLDEVLTDPGESVLNDNITNRQPQ